MCQHGIVPWLDHVVDLSIASWGTATLISTVVVPVFVPSTVKTFFLHIYANICCHFFLILVIAIGIKWISQRVLICISVVATGGDFTFNEYMYL